MGLIRGCHSIGGVDQKEAQEKALEIASQILQRGLRVNQAGWGKAAWSHYIDLVPKNKIHWPFVVFDVDEKYVEPFPKGNQFSDSIGKMMKMNTDRGDYIPISVLGFVNIHFPFYTYTWSIRFIG